MRGTFPLCFGAWLVLAMPAQALDLHQAYVLSLAQDATVRAAQAAAAAGQERVPQARAQMLPQLSASAAGYSNRLDARTGNLPSTERDYPSRNATLTLRQAVFRPMLAAGYRQAQAQADADRPLQRVAESVEGIADVDEHRSAEITRQIADEFCSACEQMPPADLSPLRIHWREIVEAESAHAAITAREEAFGTRQLVRIRHKGGANLPPHERVPARAEIKDPFGFDLQLHEVVGCADAAC